VNGLLGNGSGIRQKKNSYLCSQYIKSGGKLKFWRPKPCPEMYGGWEANTPTKLLLRYL